jgi:6-phosphofructokinase 1
MGDKKEHDLKIGSPRLYHSGQAKLFSSDVLESSIEAPDHQVTNIHQFRVANITEWLPDLTKHDNKFFRTRLGGKGRKGYKQKITHDQLILMDIVRRSNDPNGIAFARSGPRDYTLFQPTEVKAAIVTCGGLCPGLNDVIEEMVQMLYCKVVLVFFICFIMSIDNYSVDTIYGIKSGFRGFHEDEYLPFMLLTPLMTKNIHKRGGTFLGSSRGGFDKDKIIDTCVKFEINQLYIIGGDGTHRAAHILYQESRARKLKMTVVGVPKTIGKASFLSDNLMIGQIMTLVSSTDRM